MAPQRKDQIMKTLRTVVATFVAAGLCFATPTLRADDNDTKKDRKKDRSATTSDVKLSSHDQKFVEDVSQDNLAEIKMAQLATDKSQRDDVKQFGQKLVQDHMKAGHELTQLAQQKGLMLSQDLEKQHAKMMDHMSAMSGADFDRTFLRHMVRDHEKNVKKFEKASAKADDADLKAFADKTLPALREHLSMARNLSGEKSASTRDEGPQVHEPSGAPKAPSEKDKE
jgi:putative membrane protein